MAVVHVALTESHGGVALIARNNERCFGRIGRTSVDENGSKGMDRIIVNMHKNRRESDVLLIKTIRKQKIAASDALQVTVTRKKKICDGRVLVLKISGHDKSRWTMKYLGDDLM